MQASILQFPVYDHMTVTEGRFNRAESRINDALERVSRLEGQAPTGTRRAASPLAILGGAAAVVVTLIVGFVSATHTIDADIDSKFGGLNTRLTKAEGAIKALGDQQPGQTQQLIRDLLAAAQSGSDPKLAAKATQTATVLTAALRTAKTPAPPEFFQSSVDVLNEIGANPEVSKVAFTAKVALAEYRSAIVPLPNRASMRTGVPHELECMPPGNDYPNHLTDVSARLDTINLISTNNCWQRLDNVRWHNIAFVNMRIRYLGGDLDLQNVLFINCTFEIKAAAQKSVRTQKLLNYAALDQRVLTISGE